MFMILIIVIVWEYSFTEAHLISSAEISMHLFQAMVQKMVLMVLSISMEAQLVE